jgi:protein-disulfide isomerase
MMKNPWVIVGAICVVLFGGAIWFSNLSSSESNEGIEILSHTKGNPEATVVLTEYSDFQCPACAAFQPVLADLLEQYGDQLLLEYKHFPLFTVFPHSQSAAIAAEAAGQQGKFFEFHDRLFADQQTWSSAAIPTTFYVRYAEELGLDIDQFRRQLRSTALRDKVRAEFNEAQELGLTGTPTFFLNGVRMSFDTYQDFSEQVVRAIDPSLLETAGDAEGSDAPGQPAGDVRFGF